MRFILAAALFAAMAGAAVAETAPAAAAPKPRMSVEERFKTANTTGDGHLTFAQAQARMPRVAHNFEAIDKDRKGYVTLADVRAYDAERRRARKAGQSAQAAPAPAAPAAN